MPGSRPKANRPPLLLAERFNSYSPSQVGAFVLQKMKETADQALQKDINKAVITVPAYFNDAQRQATKDAGKIAGLEVARIINEPTAAALAFGLNKTSSGVVAVFDLGGGTFDISLLEISGGVFEVKATNGDTYLGGEDVDIALRNHFMEVFQKETGVDLSSDTVTGNRFREAAEKAKKELDHSKVTPVEIPFINGEHNFRYEFTREKFEEIIEPIIRRCVEPCKQCLKDAGMERSTVNQILLVGGMTRVPLVVETVRKFFGKEPSKGVNPDEVVAQGAAIQGSILKGDTKGLVLIDVTPLSLGTEIVGGVFSRIINRNTSIPCKNEQEYTTVKDMQTDISIKVYQGERDIAAHNQLLGQFVLDGIPPLPKSVPKILISFELDSNGVVSVVAKDKGSGSKRTLKVQTKGGLSDEQVQKMVREAEIMKEFDGMHKRYLEKVQEAESTVTSTKSFLSEHGEKFEGRDTYTKLQEDCSALGKLADEKQGRAPTTKEGFEEDIAQLQAGIDKVLEGNQALYKMLG
eukprot:NODE_298_length_1946_cov_82.917765_g249_i0.p1 GENE.NODE_298_length_1946_cov_82.917765_g249_i0~~NODE_298_length_1946_cov_82.917765_g249_i0.p1  ORF type:complete len:521 (+),score=218.39 NODE_298_length_1946_cov_82.917765_g249_i0:165-1727(+)